MATKASETAAVAVACEPNRAMWAKAIDEATGFPLLIEVARKILDWQAGHRPNCECSWCRLMTDVRAALLAAGEVCDG